MSEERSLFAVSIEVCQCSFQNCIIQTLPAQYVEFLENVCSRVGLKLPDATHLWICAHSL